LKKGSFITKRTFLLIFKFLMRFISIFFILWSLLLTGIFHPNFSPPGLIQAIQLKAFIYEKRKKRIQLQKENISLKKKIQVFKTNPSVQEKEIRERLNYTSKDELIFYFR